MLALPRQQKHQPHARANGAVGHVEGRETDFVAAPLPQVKANEINDSVPRVHFRRLPNDNVSCLDLRDKDDSFELFGI